MKREKLVYISHVKYNEHSITEATKCDLFISVFKVFMIIIVTLLLGLTGDMKYHAREKSLGTSNIFVTCVS